MTDDPEIRDAFDAKQAVLGALMLGGDSAFAKVATLRPEHMTDARHRWLMGVLLELHAERTPVRCRDGGRGSGTAISETRG